MLLIDDRKQQAKMRAMGWWRSWFAWYPVQVENGDIVWLERVQRRTDFVNGFDGTYAFHRYRRVGRALPPERT